VAQPGDIYLGATGSEAKITALGRRYVEDTDKIARTARTSSGRLVEDIIADKKTFRLTYSTIDGEDLEALEALYDLHTEMSLIVHYRYGKVGTYTVRMQPIKKRREKISNYNAGLWANVDVILEEV
jgi:hypothetical protein